MDDAVLHIDRRDAYTVIDNSIFMDYSLTMKAKGLYCQMRSLPDGWHFSIAGLAALCKDGRSAITSALQELEDRGYLERTRERAENGTFEKNVFILYESPGYTCKENKETECFSEDELPQLDQEGSEKFEILCKASLKRIKNIKKIKALYRARLKEGYTPSQIIAAYKKYVECYKSHNPRTIQYAKRLENWLIDADGLEFFVDRSQKTSDLEQLIYTADGFWVGALPGETMKMIKGSEKLTADDKKKARTLLYEQSKEVCDG